MQFILNSWHLLFFILCGLVNQQAQQIIAFQNAQIKALLKIMGRKRVLLTDDLRRIIAVKGKILGRKAMRELTTIVTPDTILRWHMGFIQWQLKCSF